jgi:predicted Rossmann-fold nucleotide-binding protein
MTSKVFVACGSRTTSNKIYLDIAKSIGAFLAQHNYTYGQGGYVERNTLMGESYFEYLKNGGNNVVFIIKEKYKSDIEGCKYSDVIYADNSNDMVEKIKNWADFEIFLPGGNGTLHEIISALESKDLSYSNTKLILLNINSYYNDLLKQYKKMETENLLRKNFLEDLIYIVDNLEDLFSIIENDKK